MTPRKNLALTYKAESKLDEAKTVLQEAIAEVENNLVLRTELAQVMEATQDYDGAINQYEAIYDMNGSQLAANNLAMLIVTYKSDEASLEKASKNCREPPWQHEPDVHGYTGLGLPEAFTN